MGNRNLSDQGEVRGLTGCFPPGKQKGRPWRAAPKLSLVEDQVRTYN